MENGYSICLNEWALDKEIKNELGLLLIISSLTAEKGFCYASNSYLANLFGTDEVQISKKIAKLVKKGYLAVSYTKKGTEITSREIRLSKMTTDRCQNSQPTVVKNDKENIISINNININKRESKERKFNPPSVDEIKEYITEKKLNVDGQKFFDFFDTGGWIDSRGNKVKNWKQKLITWDSHSQKKESKLITVNYTGGNKDDPYGL